MHRITPNKSGSICIKQHLARALHVNDIFEYVPIICASRAWLKGKIFCPISSTHDGLSFPALVGYWNLKLSALLSGAAFADETSAAGLRRNLQLLSPRANHLKGSGWTMKFCALLSALVAYATGIAATDVSKLPVILFHGLSDDYTAGDNYVVNLTAEAAPSCRCRSAIVRARSSRS
ncbi:unnamed protein product [Phytophthora lilii]|uniref:Unnamed protein product n=1 Tax=Phytophthora lilii TaxID=2077276 RepID=A0A9W6XGQ7_9STRA|nr:unnamed protein product [Phytophthora lilii]